ncbi:LacI family DNA-binding transcriptional regulator [Aliikangiella sp. G2MR2-5]|uniref:LacI family DNA-binding transcriptional regulator n=1 Tax=Aliikangiella sp. G2MR2-5 TaxID=2788943 RepID=UPI0018A9F62C|nr:LacI family DNA-binding transcriptional regulator [Aliikangiella sp. G2MR2-5]
MKGKATSFDIAHQAGVSQSTVSRALRDSPLVNEETRERIKAIAKELNYKVDKNASNLRSQQSGTIALLLFQDPTSDDSQINPFFLSMLGSITRACTQKGYDLLVSFQQLEDDWHADYEDCHKADGIILLGYGDYTDYEEKLIQLEQQGTHFVRWGAVKKGQPGVSIGCDNFQGGFDVTEHLIKSGKSHVAFIGGASRRSPEFFDRYKGSCAALEKGGVKVNPKLQIDAITTEQSGYAAALQLLALKQPFDAIFCASDLIAIGVVKALRERGKKIPEEIAVVGYDNIPLSEFIRPTLTTVQQDTKLAGEVLVETLISSIKDEPVDNRMLPAKLIVRESCGG